jgi:hypothetical protein
MTPEMTVLTVHRLKHSKSRQDQLLSHSAAGQVRDRRTLAVQVWDLRHADGRGIHAGGFAAWLGWMARETTLLRLRPDPLLLD